jgi:hypothetical protein
MHCGKREAKTREDLLPLFISEAVFLFAKFKGPFSAFHYSGNRVPNSFTVNRANRVNASTSLIALIVVAETGNKLRISVDYEIGVVTNENELPQRLCRHDFV